MFCREVVFDNADHVTAKSPHPLQLFDSHSNIQGVTHTPFTKPISMRIFSILLAAVTILAPVAVLGEIETNAVKDTSVSDVLHDEDLEGVAARKLEFLNLEVDQKGCYLLTGPESGLLLLLCEDDAGARKRYTDEGEC